MKKASSLQNSVIKQIEKIGDAIALIEGICKDIEKLDPALITDMGELCYVQPIIKFIINHRKYTLWYNEMRDFLFQELINGGCIKSLKKLEVNINT